MLFLYYFCKGAVSNWCPLEQDMLILMSLFQRSRIWEQLPRHLWMHKVLVRTFTWYIIMCENVKCLCQNLCMFMCRNTYIYIFDCWNLYMSNFTWGTFKLFLFKFYFFSFTRSFKMGNQWRKPSTPGCGQSTCWA